MSRRSQHEMSVLVPPNMGGLSPEDPRRIGPYLVIGRIGGGGTGTVYAAVDPMGGEDPLAAVKVLTSPVLADPGRRAQLRERLQAVAGADGRIFVPPARHDADADPPWLAMPYISGIPLAAYIRRRGPMGSGRLLALAAGLAEGLLALHRHGVAHGDLKPGCVLIGANGPRILDCALPGDEEHLRRTAGAWLSPERHRGAEPSPASDVFSWGAVMAFAATGRLPFGLGEPEELARRVQEEEPVLDGAPASLVPLLERTLDKDPGRRPSVRELMGAAIAVWEEEDRSEAANGVKGTAITKVLSREWQGVVEPARLPRVIHLEEGGVRRRGRTPLLVGAAALALALVGGGAWAALSALGGGTAPPEEAGGASPSPSASPSAEEPRVETVRFDPTAQRNPVDGPWAFTPVQRVEGMEPPEGVLLSPDTWSGYWTDAEGEPEEAVIAENAEVLCANFCRPGPGHIEDGRGTYEMTGRDFIDYLGWGRVVIAEVEIAPGEGGDPEITRITELFPDPAAV
ncbi:protein kinase domain-containing protein [Nocardiopsis potens]|uniref:protein kinase domain-containing protein n=1 Tax=Nocardiopsis potens TaxID=1246458 RepID=UPI000349D63C|nr:protein kinase [Nocardiopsis potens]